MSVSKLKKELWRVFSIYVRLRDKGVCFTCGQRNNWKYTDAGHYISRQHNATFVDEQNVHCQCKACNIFKKGNLTEYAIRLEAKYGNGILQRLHALKHTTKQFIPNELISKINYYKEQIKKLTKNL